MGLLGSLNYQLCLSVVDFHMSGDAEGKLDFCQSKTLLSSKSLISARAPNRGPLMGQCLQPVNEWQPQAVHIITCI